LRKLKLLGVLLAMMAVIASSTASPALATHWDVYSDEWGDCGYMQVGWDYHIIGDYYEPEYSTFEECHNYWLYSDDWGLFGPKWDDEEDDHHHWDDDDDHYWDSPYHP